MVAPRDGSTRGLRWTVALLLVIASGPGETLAGSGYRTDQDLLVEGAPLPDRSPRDRSLLNRELRTQLRLQLQLEKGDVGGAGDTEARLRRARGIATWKPGARWTAQTEVSLNVVDDRVEVLDAFVTYRLKRWSRLWLGQFKSMLSRSLLTSSGGMVFTERSLAVRTFIDSDFRRGAGGDIDELRGHGGGRVPRLRLTNYWYFDRGDRSGDELGIRLRAEVSQGNQAWRISGEPAWTLRLEVHPDGNPSYQEGSLAAVRQGRLAFDVAYHRDPGQLGVDLDGDGLLTERDRLAREIANAGWLYRRDRFSTQGEFFRQLQRPTAVVGGATDSRGGYFQLGWVWEPYRWEMGLRYSQVDPDAATPGDLREERGLSLVRYFDENLSKAILELVRAEDQAAPGRRDSLVRVQYQVTF